MPKIELDGGGSRPAPRRFPLWLVSVACLCLAAAAWISATTAETDSGSDLVTLARGVAYDAKNLRLLYLVTVIALAGLHYVATAIAARAASGLALPLKETNLVCLKMLKLILSQNLVMNKSIKDMVE